MLHNQRAWGVWPVSTAEELAHKLTEMTWCGCQAFSIGEYLIANDATSGDGAQEYAVLKPSPDGSRLVQIESITFSWCSEARALELIRDIVSGKYDACYYGTVDRARFTPSEAHGRCGLCT